MAMLARSWMSGKMNSAARSPPRYCQGSFSPEKAAAYERSRSHSVALSMTPPLSPTSQYMMNAYQNTVLCHNICLRALNTICLQADVEVPPMRPVPVAPSTSGYTSELERLRSQNDYLQARETFQLHE